MLTLPQRANTPNEHALAQWYTERFTNLTGTALTLSYTVAETVNLVPLLLLFKNGSLLDPSGGGSTSYTLDGAAVTLVTALVASDVVVAFYLYRN